MIKLPVFKKKKNVHTYATNLCQFKCWEYCFKSQSFPSYPDANINRFTNESLNEI